MSQKILTNELDENIKILIEKMESKIVSPEAPKTIFYNIMASNDMITKALDQALALKIS